MKRTWLEHSQDSGRKTVVYYQKEVGHLLKTLGIPATSLLELFQDEEAEAYDPLKDNRRFPNLEGTCGIEHSHGRPCQGLLARRLAEFVWSKKTRGEAEEHREEVIDAPGKETVYLPEDATVDLKEEKAIQIPEGKGTDVLEDMPRDGLSGGEAKSWADLFHQDC